MDIGRKLLELRKSRNLTQAELGKQVGVSEAAIRSYETGARKPKEKHLVKIAKALGVKQEALKEYNVQGKDEIVHYLMSLEDGYRFLYPVEIEGSRYLKFNGGDMIKWMNAWYEKLKALEKREITQEEFDAWRDSYTCKKFVDYRHE